MKNKAKKPKNVIVLNPISLYLISNTMFESSIEVSFIRRKPILFIIAFSFIETKYTMLFEISAEKDIFKTDKVNENALHFGIEFVVTITASLFMPDYFIHQEYQNHTYEREEVNFKELEQCTFRHCDFSNCNFIDVTFIDCQFYDCNFNGAKINHVALRTVTFHRCQIKDVNFAMCDKLIFEIAFEDCILDFSKFYALKLKGTVFKNCSLIAVDFMNADLTEARFENCDLYRSEFAKAIANKANFKTSFHYTIDPTTTKVKKAIFSLEGVKGLLFKHQLIINQ